MGGVLKLLQIPGSSPRWSYSQMNIWLCLFPASYTQLFCYDLSCSSSAVVPVCPLCLSTPVLHSTLCTRPISVLSSCAMPWLRDDRSGFDSWHVKVILSVQGTLKPSLEHNRPPARLFKGFRRILPSGQSNREVKLNTRHYLAWRQMSGAVPIHPLMP